MTEILPRHSVWHSGRNSELASRVFEEDRRREAE
jgi:hypothetical protein